MRTIKRTARFKRDLKREAGGQHRAARASEFVNIVEMLAMDEPLAERYRDHALTGRWKDHRDCHIKPDLVLIYGRRMTRCCSSCASVPTANLAFEWKRASPPRQRNQVKYLRLRRRPRSHAVRPGAAACGAVAPGCITSLSSRPAWPASRSELADGPTIAARLSPRHRRPGRAH